MFMEFFMKKIILSTAFVTLMSLGQNNVVLAYAADTGKGVLTALPGTIEVKTNGFFRFAMGHTQNKSKIDGQSVDRTSISYVDPVTNEQMTKAVKNRPMDFWTDANVNFRVQGQLESGLEFGAELQLEANPVTAQERFVPTTSFDGKTRGVTTSSRQSFLDGSAAGINGDKTYGWFSHDNYGRLVFGNMRGGAEQLQYFAPANFGTGGIDGIYTDFLGTEVGSQEFYKVKHSDDDTKILYITPRIEGVQAAASWTPTSGRQGRFVKRHRASLVPTTATSSNSRSYSTLTRINYENVYEFGLNYVNTFDQVGVAASLNYVTGNPLSDIQYSRKLHDKWSSWSAGMQVLYAGFNLGGSYVDNGHTGYFKGIQGTSAVNRKGEKAYSLGLQYETGPFLVGVNGGQIQTVSDTTFRGITKSTVIAWGATYKMHKGAVVFYEGVNVKRKLQDRATFTETKGRTAHTKTRGQLHLIGSKITW
jgi:hypothetical protein